MDMIAAAIESSVRTLNDEHNSKMVATLRDHLGQVMNLYKKSLNEQERLKATIADLEDQNKSFMNVSLIVATKNENSRLQNELQLLSKRIKYYETTNNSRPPPPTEHTTTSSGSADIEQKIRHLTSDETFIPKASTPPPKEETVEDVGDEDEKREVVEEDVNDDEEDKEEVVEEDVNGDEEEDDDEEEINVTEQTIGGKLYFVSDDDDRIVYAREFVDGDWEVGDEIGHARLTKKGLLVLVKKKYIS